MPQQKRNPLSVPAAASLKPGQDILVRKKASAFPQVGMTLSSYGSQTMNSPAVSSKAAAKSSVPPVLPPPTRGGSATNAPKPKKQRRRIFTLKRFALVIVLIVLLVGGYLGFKFVYEAHKIFGNSIFSVLNTTKLSGEDVGRVNILVAGNSSDDPLHQGADLTDSIMLVSIDTINHKAYLISIPRDLWVNVPGYGSSKINAAYVDGQNGNFSQAGYPSGGMGQLAQVVENDFNIKVNYTALVDYTAFRDAVDAVGGINVTINSSDKRGLYDPSIDYVTHGPLVRLTNGPHLLNGEQALDLARARGDTYGAYGFPNADFDRTANQRLMIVALKNKAESVGTLSNPAKVSSLASAIGNNVQTDLKLNEVLRLYTIMKSIPSSNIYSVSLNNAYGQNLLANYTASDGEEALIPAAGIDDFSDIQAFFAKIMSSNPVVQENATVVVLNATQTSGLASTQEQKLQNLGLNVVGIGDATSTQSTTSIIDLSGGKSPATRALLAKTYGGHFTTLNPYSGVYTADYIVLIGQDQVPNSTTNGTQ